MLGFLCTLEKLPYGMGVNLLFLHTAIILSAMFSLITILIMGIVYTDGKEANLTERPIIGILAETTFGKSANFGKYYIAASYVKFIESAGGRAMPIFPNATSDDIKKIFNSINGVLFPGGGVSLTKSGYSKNGKLFYELAIKAYDSGVTFPVFGTCLGFELLNVITSNNKVVFSRVDAENLPSPLDFVEGFKKSRMFKNAPDDLIKSVQESSLTMNNHHWATTPENFHSNQNLSSFYNIISTNKDREGKVYVSTIEGKHYPIYGVQWHPEKNQFEWTPRESIPHSTQAIAIGQYMANFLVNQARKNNHRFPSIEEEEESLIYNFLPKYTTSYSNFTQIYYF